MSVDRPIAKATVRPDLILAHSARTLHPLLPIDKPIIVTIDGPAGTGKSTVARLLARQLGLDFLDTGAMYRAAAAVALDAGLDLALDAATVQRILDVASRADIRFDWTSDPPTILAFGLPIAHRIRRADVTAVVSPVAGIPALRALMVSKQRRIAGEHPRLVSEGRDQGSVVFPDAAVKIYLDADPRVRAVRRAAQLSDQGASSPPIDALLAEINARDASDRGRSDGPLTCPPGADVVDTSALSMDQVVESLERLVLSRFK